MTAMLAVLAGCESSPAKPTAAPPLLNGTYVLSISAPDGTFINDQAVAACPGAGRGGYGVIMANAMVDAQGATSRVRPSTAADGTFEIRLVHGSATPQFGVSITGSIRGVAINTIYSFQPGGTPLDARATFSGPPPATDAQVEGVISGNSAVITGLVSGNVAVGNAAGDAVSCTSGTVRWSLSRVS